MTAKRPETEIKTSRTTTPKHSPEKKKARRNNNQAKQARSSRKRQTSPLAVPLPVQDEETVSHEEIPPGTSYTPVSTPSDSRISSRLSSVAETLHQLSLTGGISPDSGSSLHEAENYFLKKENEELKAQLKKAAMSFEDIEQDDKLIKMYTGIPNKQLFDTLLELFENITLVYYIGWSVVNIPKRTQLLITLMKLRLNLLHADLAFRFKVSSATITNVVYTWVHALHEVLCEQLMKEIPSRQKNQTCLPTSFSTFTNCRIVLDCTELAAFKPGALDKQKMTYSSYKHRNTCKGLVGVAPNGVITFVSTLYPGSVSDKQLVKHCGVLQKMVPGDLILADKGFLIGEFLPSGVNLNVPPFLTTPQFTKEQAVQTKTIARARIHVERAIGRIKCFDILDAIPRSLAPLAGKVFKVCAALTNMQFPLIADILDNQE